ncbi:MAG: sulfatase-like hydrolase/transferase, partial [Candidatus Krumholzibacteria bacterium]|nr:sulfatase-like hydrolase/transferase [Candidatus Krumholzibacteria bacterium]
TTPNIFALGRESSVLLNHLSSGNQTTCGIFGLFYGLHPTYWTAVKANSASIDNPILIDVLKKRGYAFGIFARSNFERHKIKDTIFNGIEVHEEFAGRTIPEQDMDMNRQIIGFMEDQARLGKPFMALAFYKSCHAPYEYPREHAIFGDTKNVGLTLTGDTDPAPYLNDYHNAVHFVDALAGEIIDGLKALGVLERTVVVVTTDHGESFNEGGANFWGHGSSFTQDQIKVPMILHAPGRPPQRIELRTSHIDLAPTLLHDYFGCTSDVREYSNGRNLFDGTQGQRPLVIGSYVTHAFVFGDDVYEILPAYTKKYKLNDVREAASQPPADALKTVMDEINRFIAR